MKSTRLFAGAIALCTGLTLLSCGGRSEPRSAAPQGDLITYQCQDGTTFSARFSATEAVADLPDQPNLALPQVESGSGTKYSDGTTTLWTKGEETFVEVDGDMLFVDCVAIAPEAAPTETASNATPEKPAPNSYDERCDIYPAGEDQASASVPCAFSQHQGNVYIDREDGVSYALTPVGDEPGNYVDENGKAAYRQSGLGDAGHIYRLANESIYIYWGQGDAANTASAPSQPQSPPPQTAPSTPPPPREQLNTSVTVRNYDEIAIEIGEGGEFYFSGVLRRGENAFVGSDNQTQVTLTPNDGHVVVFSKSTGDVWYDYYIEPVLMGEDPATMCDPSVESC